VANPKGPSANPIEINQIFHLAILNVTCRRVVVENLHTLKMLGCFNPPLGQIWTNPNVGLKMSFKNVTQWLGSSIFDPKLG